MKKTVKAVMARAKTAAKRKGKTLKARAIQIEKSVGKDINVLAGQLTTLAKKMVKKGGKTIKRELGNLERMAKDSRRKVGL